MPSPAQVLLSAAQFRGRGCFSGAGLPQKAPSSKGLGFGAVSRD